MLDRLHIATKDHHARIRAMLDRPLRNQFPRQIVIVIAQPGTHADSILSQIRKTRALPRKQEFAAERKILNDGFRCGTRLLILLSQRWKRFARRVITCPARRGCRSGAWKL